MTDIWTVEKQQRLDALRLGEAQSTLSDAEHAEMEALFAELDADEARAMRTVFANMDRTKVELQQEIEARAAEALRLERIVREHEQLLAEARACLSQLRARRAQLADEYRQVTGGDLTKTG